MIRLIFVGKVKEEWLRDQIEEYTKRLTRFTRIEIEEINDEKILGEDYDKIKKKEGEKILELLKDDYAIALDVNGKSLASEDFAKAVKTAGDQNKRVTFIIGGALGLSDEVLKRCQLKVS